MTDDGCTAASQYRESEEWQAVEAAVQNLLNRTNELHEDERGLVADFSLVVHEVPEVSAESSVAGGYLNYATSGMPHVNIGLADNMTRYWRGVYNHGE